MKPNCEHRSFMRVSGTNAFICLDCNQVFGDIGTNMTKSIADWPPPAWDDKEYCPKCGRRMEDLLLFNSYVKICRHCEESGKEPVKSTKESSVDQLDLDFDDYFNNKKQ